MTPCLPISAFFALVLALSALPALAFIRTPLVTPTNIAPPSKDSILLDFENGNFIRKN